MKKVWMKRMDDSEKTQQEGVAIASEDSEEGIIQKPLPIKKSRHKVQRTMLKLSSPEGLLFLSELQKYSFDTSYKDSYWRIENVELVNNKKLETKFNSYKEELIELGRSKEEMQEIFLFSAENKNACEDICKNGQKVGNKKRHVLGFTGSGIHLVKHYDILTRYMIFNQLPTPAYIIAYKAFLGKCKPIVPRLHRDDNYVSPYAGFDCHVSARTVGESMPICEALNCSYIYTYEYDDVSSNTVKHPRQVLPYAIIHLNTKPPICLESPFLAVKRKDKMMNWEVKGETRRGFRFTCIGPKCKRKYVKSKATSGINLKTALKEQLLEKRSTCTKITPPTLVKYDKDKEKNSVELKEGTAAESEKPPTLHKYAACTVKFGGEKFSIPANNGKDSVVQNKDSSHELSKSDELEVSEKKSKDRLSEKGSDTKSCKTTSNKTDNHLNQRTCHGALPLSLKPYVYLKRLEHSSHKSKCKLTSHNTKHKNKEDEVSSSDGKSNCNNVDRPLTQENIDKQKDVVLKSVDKNSELPTTQTKVEHTTTDGSQTIIDILKRPIVAQEHFNKQKGRESKSVKTNSKILTIETKVDKQLTDTSQTIIDILTRPIVAQENIDKRKGVELKSVDKNLEMLSTESKVENKTTDISQTIIDIQTRPVNETNNISESQKEDWSSVILNPIKQAEESKQKDADVDNCFIKISRENRTEQNTETGSKECVNNDEAVKQKENDKDCNKTKDILETDGQNVHKIENSIEEIKSQKSVVLDESKTKNGTDLKAPDSNESKDTVEIEVVQSDKTLPENESSIEELDSTNCESNENKPNDNTTVAAVNISDELDCSEKTQFKVSSSFVNECLTKKVKDVYDFDENEELERDFFQKKRNVSPDNGSSVTEGKDSSIIKQIQEVLSTTADTPTYLDGKGCTKTKEMLKEKPTIVDTETKSTSTLPDETITECDSTHTELVDKESIKTTAITEANIDSCTSNLEDDGKRRYIKCRVVKKQQQTNGNGNGEDNILTDRIVIIKTNDNFSIKKGDKIRFSGSKGKEKLTNRKLSAPLSKHIIEQMKSRLPSVLDRKTPFPETVNELQNSKISASLQTTKHVSQEHNPIQKPKPDLKTFIDKDLKVDHSSKPCKRLKRSLGNAASRKSKPSKRYSSVGEQSTKIKNDNLKSAQLSSPNCTNALQTQNLSTIQAHALYPFTRNIILTPTMIPSRMETKSTKSRSPPAAVAAPDILNLSPKVASTETDKSIRNDTQSIVTISRPKFPTVDMAHVDHSQNKQLTLPVSQETIRTKSPRILNPHPEPLRSPPDIFNFPVQTKSSPYSGPVQTKSPSYSGPVQTKSPSYSGPMSQPLAKGLQTPAKNGIMTLIQFRHHIPQSNINVVVATRYTTPMLQRPCPSATYSNQESHTNSASVSSDTPNVRHIGISSDPESGIKGKTKPKTKNSFDIPGIIQLPNEHEIRYQLKDQAQSAQQSINPTPTVNPQVTPPETESKYNYVYQTETEADPPIEQALVTPITPEILPLPCQISPISKNDQSQNDTVPEPTNSVTSSENVTEMISLPIHTSNTSHQVVTSNYPPNDNINRSKEKKNVTVDGNTAKRLQQFLKKLPAPSPRSTPSPSTTVRSPDIIQQTSPVSSIPIYVNSQPLNDEQERIALQNYIARTNAEFEREASEKSCDVKCNIALLTQQSNGELKSQTQSTIKYTSDHKRRNTSESASTRTSMYQELLAEIQDNDSQDTIIGGVEDVEQHSLESPYNVPINSMDTNEQIKIEKDLESLTDIKKNESENEKQSNKVQTLKDCTQVKVEPANEEPILDNFVPLTPSEGLRLALGQNAALENEHNTANNNSTTLDAIKRVEVKLEQISSNDYPNTTSNLTDDIDRANQNKTDELMSARKNWLDPLVETKKSSVDSIAQINNKSTDAFVKDTQKSMDTPKVLSVEIEHDLPEPLTETSQISSEPLSIECHVKPIENRTKHDSTTSKPHKHNTQQHTDNTSITPNLELSKPKLNKTKQVTQPHIDQTPPKEHGPLSDQTKIQENSHAIPLDTKEKGENLNLEEIEQMKKRSSAILKTSEICDKEEIEPEKESPPHLSIFSQTEPSINYAHPPTLFSRFSDRRKLGVKNTQPKTTIECKSAIMETLLELSDVLKLLKKSNTKHQQHQLKAKLSPIENESMLVKANKISSSSQIVRTEQSKKLKETVATSKNTTSKSSCQNINECNKTAVSSEKSSITENVAVSDKIETVNEDMQDVVVKQERIDSGFDMSQSCKSSFEISKQTSSKETVSSNENISIKSEPFDQGDSEQLSSVSADKHTSELTREAFEHQTEETEYQTHANLCRQNDCISPDEMFTATKLPYNPEPAKTDDILNIFELNEPYQNINTAKNALLENEVVDDVPIIFDHTNQPDLTSLETFGNENWDIYLKTKSRPLNKVKEVVSEPKMALQSHDQEQIQNVPVATPFQGTTKTTGRLNKALKDRKNMFDLKTRYRRSHSNIFESNIQHFTKQTHVAKLSPKDIEPTESVATVNSQTTHTTTFTQNTHSVLYQTISLELEKLKRSSNTPVTNEYPSIDEGSVIKHTTTNSNGCFQTPAEQIGSIKPVLNESDPIKPTEEIISIKNMKSSHTDSTPKPFTSSDNQTSPVTNLEAKTDTKTKETSEQTTQIPRNLGLSDGKNQQKPKIDIIPFHEVMRKKYQQFQKYQRGETSNRFIDYKQFKEERKRKLEIKEKSPIGKKNNTSCSNNMPTPSESKPSPDKLPSDDKEFYDRKRVSQISVRGTKLYEDFGTEKENRDDSRKRSLSADRDTKAKKICRETKERRSRKDNSPSRSNSRHRSRSTETSTSSKHRTNSREHKHRDERSRSRSRHRSEDKNIRKPYPKDVDDSFDATKYKLPFKPFKQFPFFNDGDKFRPFGFGPRNTFKNGGMDSDKFRPFGFGPRNAFKKGGMGYFSWKNKYQPFNQTPRNNFVKRRYQPYNLIPKHNVVITNKGNIQTVDECHRWQQFKERENIRNQIEKAIRDYRRTFEDTNDDAKGDEKVSSYLQYLTGKLDVIQCKRSNIAPSNLPIKSEKGRGKRIEPDSRPKVKESKDRNQTKQKSYNPLMILQDKLHRAEQRHDSHQSLNLNDSIVSTLSSSLGRESTDVIEKVSSNSTAIESMFRTHLMKHVQNVKDQIKDELTKEIVKGMSKTGADSNLNLSPETRYQDMNKDRELKIKRHSAETYQKSKKRSLDRDSDDSRHEKGDNIDTFHQNSSDKKGKTHYKDRSSDSNNRYDDKRHNDDYSGKIHSENRSKHHTRNIRDNETNIDIREINRRYSDDKRSENRSHFHGRDQHEIFNFDKRRTKDNDSGFDYDKRRDKDTDFSYDKRHNKDGDLKDDYNSYDKRRDKSDTYTYEKRLDKKSDLNYDSKRDKESDRRHHIDDSRGKHNTRDHYVDDHHNRTDEKYYNKNSSRSNDSYRKHGGNSHYSKTSETHSSNSKLKYYDDPKQQNDFNDSDASESPEYSKFENVDVYSAVKSKWDDYDGEYNSDSDDDSGNKKVDYQDIDIDHRNKHSKQSGRSSKFDLEDDREFSDSETIDSSKQLHNFDKVNRHGERHNEIKFQLRDDTVKPFVDFRFTRGNLRGFNRGNFRGNFRGNSFRGRFFRGNTFRGGFRGFRGSFRGNLRGFHSNKFVNDRVNASNSDNTHSPHGHKQNWYSKDKHTHHDTSDKFDKSYNADTYRPYKKYGKQSEDSYKSGLVDYKQGKKSYKNTKDHKSKQNKEKEFLEIKIEMEEGDSPKPIPTVSTIRTPKTAKPVFKGSQFPYPASPSK